jgi:hypothetical protein
MDDDMLLTEETKYTAMDNQEIKSNKDLFYNIKKM